MIITGLMTMMIIIMIIMIIIMIRMRRSGHPAVLGQHQSQIIIMIMAIMVLKDDENAMSMI